MTKKSKGLGDTISKITEATGIKAVVDKVSELTGIDCGCEERKQALNKLYPYSRQMTEDEIKIYEEVMSRTKGTITKQDQIIMVKIYNKVFNKNKTPSSCSSCVKNTLNQLEKVYENSCKTEK
jgi:hypothetical protein|tara:strand:- start:411 stop:779 length:369 start_codon:yes stop_codon:yes gene_type:complete